MYTIKVIKRVAKRHVDFVTKSCYGGTIKTNCVCQCPVPFWPLTMPLQNTKKHWVTLLPKATKSKAKSVRDLQTSNIVKPVYHRPGSPCNGWRTPHKWQPQPFSTTCLRNIRANNDSAAPARQYQVIQVTLPENSLVLPRLPGKNFIKY